MDEATRRRRAAVIILAVLAIPSWWTWEAGMGWLLIPAWIGVGILAGSLFFRIPGGTR